MNNYILVDPSEFSSRLAYFLLVEEKNVKNYIEFGSYNGTSLIIANKVFNYLSCNDVNYYCFDSFSGLPKLTLDDDFNSFQEGLFSCSKSDFYTNLNKNNFPINRLKVYEGYFKDTFKTIEKNTLPNCDVFMFDCDLYSSTKDALNFSFDFIEKSCIFIFDDWYSSDSNNGQQRALNEFLNEHKNIKLKNYIYYKYFGRDAGIIYDLEKV